MLDSLLNETVGGTLLNVAFYTIALVALIRQRRKNQRLRAMFIANNLSHCHFLEMIGREVNTLDSWDEDKRRHISRIVRGVHAQSADMVLELKK